MATRSGGSKRGATRRQAPARGRARTRGDKSVEAFREALERSVTISRDRLQEVMDDAVERGRMTRSDANELVSSLVSRGRKNTDDLVRHLERLLEQARREIEARMAPTQRAARRSATATQRAARRSARQAARAARDAADRPLAQADRLRRRARVPGGSPITAYDQLTVAQIKSRLGELSPADLRKVRDQERRGKARKSVLADVDKRLKR